MSQKPACYSEAHTHDLSKQKDEGGINTRRSNAMVSNLSLGKACRHVWLCFVHHLTIRFLLCFSLTMGQLYDKEKDEDGFLYVAYSGENTFGYKAFYTAQG